jgi:hypothetical protein
LGAVIFSHIEDRIQSAAKGFGFCILKNRRKMTKENEGIE